uniref:Uncharacterized protein n=1 Tax=Anguilla anguilla TaxID=7936 RepID=A0A0E9QSN7_ANGAN
MIGSLSDEVTSYLQALPRKASSQEVHEHVTQSFQVVSSALFCKGRSDT